MSLNNHNIKTTFLIGFILQIFFSFSVYSQCNGSVYSCNKRYNEVAYLTTHNSFNSGQDGFILPNQNNNIATQLNDGVRGLMIDVYDNGGTTVTYHGFPFLGSEPLSTSLEAIKNFLDNNPNEIVTIIFQNDPAVSANAIETDFTQAGLMDYLHTQNRLTTWPSLQTMIDTDKRLVIFNEVNNAGVGQDWYHHIWDYAVEINYGTVNCDYNRGNPLNGLFVFNHFVTSGTGTANTTEAQMANSNPFFINHVMQCQDEKNKFPNFIAVDFYDLGNTMDVVGILNALNIESGGNNDNGNSPGYGSDNTNPNVLQLENGGQITIKANGSLNLKGLKLKPNVDYTLVADNMLTRSLDALGSAPNESMARVFNFNSAVNDFTGEIIYYYDDVDLGNITHENAVLQIKNDSDIWNSYEDEDTDNNQITHTFESPIQLKSVTASASEITLGVNPVIENMTISVFPNPVTSELNIKYENNLTTTIIDFLGRPVITTPSKTINMSSLPNGIYIVRMTDMLTNKTNSYKVIKQ
ncbi:phosphatidylinositol-specific phospholipase C domain-containing protein [Winogradskyella bathintestinalis]|uniref:T9SS type A sorting domain-containing protein n=1 Tax=Winogradskyella bathintestinalis TaxID=3035208 RepID=A0ABT7ZUS8_9FLAO|nr:phosphatidylinositol-specific phospholipase C domain-containing protein [Winogradskyella bathintestinalis]MDN3492730.1 T9SS type A sorting domain-containing protein [Winogradskyella bathintestinalis]